MSKKIMCPYCGNVMESRVLGLNKNKVCFYECPKCLSRSPFSWNEATAKGMAQMRAGKKQ